MSDSSKCPRCGNELPTGFPGGACPVCLMQQGFASGTHFSSVGAAASDSGRRKSWVPPTPAELAPRFPQLEIMELLGQGGMGAVYKVRQRDLDRWAALKVLPDEVAHDPNFSERFLREARALALLGHQHIVTVYEFGQRAGVFFLLMEYIDGVTLRQAIRARGITDREALAIVAQICEALQFAHEEGVVHRDIKPENILIDRRGRVKIADFGLAKLLGRAFEVPTLTGTHQVMGTPVYMAPEQMEGTRGVDHRADIFSLGVVFYELLTGELPLGRFAPPSQKYKLDVRLDDVVLRTLEKEPERRYQQASDVKIDVESIRNQPGQISPTQIAAPPTKVEKPRRRWKWTKRVLALIVLSSVSFAGSVFYTENKNLRRYIAELDRDRMETATRAADAVRKRKQAEDELARQNKLLQKAPAPNVQPPAIVNFHDPNEQDAIVQFVDSVPRLNSEFGKEELKTPTANPRVAGGLMPRREIVNSVMATVHNEFLAIESRYSDWHVKPDHSQVTVVNRFSDDVKRLEHWFWKSIDSRLSVDEQKFLRKNLPLFANIDDPLPTVQQWKERLRIEKQQFNRQSTTSTQNPRLMKRPIESQSEQGSFIRLVKFASTENPSNSNEKKEIPNAINLRYMQLLGWDQDQPGENSARRDLFPIRIAISRHGNWYRWKIEIPKADLNREGEGIVEQEFDLADSGYDPELPSGLRRFWKQNVSDDQNFPQPTAQVEDGVLFRPSVNAAETNNGNDPAIAHTTDRNISDESSEQFAIPVNRYEDHRDPVDESSFNKSTDSVARIPLQSLENEKEVIEFSEARHLRAPEDLSFESVMQNIELLDQAKDERRNVYQSQIENYLTTCHDRTQKLAIHRKLVEVLSSKKLRQHAPELEHHAIEALKYERDPIGRGRLFAILGKIAEIHDNDPESFLESRVEASHWYLKGYKELLPFRLPEIAPELPEIEVFQESAEDNDEVNPERTAAKLRFEQQTNQRKQVEFIRELIIQRGVYIGRLNELFVRLHAINDADTIGMVRFFAIAEPVIHDKEVLHAIWSQIKNWPAAQYKSGESEFTLPDPTFRKKREVPAVAPKDPEAEDDVAPAVPASEPSDSPESDTKPVEKASDGLFIETPDHQ